MEPILRALAVYAFLWVLLRIGGKRTLAEITVFDFVLLLIVGESTQQALIGDDYSVSAGFLVIATLMATDVGLSLLKERFPRLERALDGAPMVLVDRGKPLRDRMRMERVDEEDILEAARKLQGLERMEQVKYAILERNGGISIIPAEKE